MEELFEALAAYVALGCEVGAVICVAVGAVSTFIVAVPTVFRRDQTGYAGLWRRFAVWLALSLEFALAADIAETVIAPTWDDIGKLAAIAAIRTILNLFLERDLEFVSPFLPRRFRPKLENESEQQADIAHKTSVEGP